MPNEPEEQELPERWSARRKTEIVLQLLRGEDLAAVSREIQVAPQELGRLASGVPGERRPRTEEVGSQSDGAGADPHPGQGRGVDDEAGDRLRSPRKKGVRGRPEEAVVDAGAVSPAMGRRYPLSWVCAIYRVSRSSQYARRRGAVTDVAHGKRGPKTAWSDDELVAAIKDVLKDRPFLSEGHRKVTARLRQRGMRIGKNRVLRLMRRENLLAPVRRGRPHGDRTHSGTILAERPNDLWGTDATRFYSRREGWCWFFGAIDHHVADIVGWHVAKRAIGGAGADPPGGREHFLAYAPKIALGLGLRHDWGPQYTAHPFAGELAWLGIRSTPAFVGDRDCNGVMERWIRNV